MSGDQISLVKNVGTDQVAIQTSENSLMVLQAGQQGPPGPINAISGTGIVVQSALNTFVTRSVVAGSSGITVTNGDGVAGNVSLALAAVLVSIVAGTMNGVAIGGTTPAAGAFTTLSATGVATFAGGTAAAPGIAFAVAANTGWYRGASAGRLNGSHAGVAAVSVGGGGVFVPSTGFFAFTASSDPDVGTGDAFLLRDAANTIAQRNSTNAQIFRLYNTYTDASNYERLGIAWVSNLLEFRAQSAGTGVQRGMQFDAGGAAINFAASGTGMWQFGLGQSGRPLIPFVDNSYDIGTTSLRPRDIFVAGTLYVGATAAYLGSKVNIQQTATVTASATDVGTYIARIDQPATNSASVSAGLFVESTFNAGTTVTGTTQHGIYGRVAMANSGTGALTNARAFVAEVTQSNGARTTSVATGYYVATATVSAGTVTSFHGFYCLDQASANITTAYAYRGSMASAANRWNIYMDGTAPNYFAGNIYAGTLTQLASERFALQASDASTSGSPRMIFARFTLNPGSASTMDAIVAQFRSTVTTNNGANARGIRADLETGTSITVPQFVGFETTTSLSATAGVLTTGYGFFSQPGTNGTMGTWQSFCAAADGGNITNHYGFRGLLASGANKFNLYMDGTAQNYLAGNLNMAVGASIGWGTTSTPDVALVRDGAANTLAQRNGTNAQIKRLYNTYTDASNYERLAIQWSSNIAQITTQAAGTGVTTRQLSVFTGGQAHVNLGTNGTTRWIIEGTSNLGHLIAAADNSYDIGAAGATRPRSLYVGSRGVFGAATVTYSASMTIDASTGNTFTITATNGTAFTINAPTNPTSGQRIVVLVRNTSGGALGVATWNAVFKMTAWTNPANGNSRSIEFTYNGTNWIEIDRGAADVPN